MVPDDHGSHAISRIFQIDDLEIGIPEPVFLGTESRRDLSSGPCSVHNGTLLS